MTYSDRVIVQTADVRVRQMFLDVDAEVAWHYHTQVVDTMYCLQGTMKVEMKGPEEVNILYPGEGCEITVGRPHRISVIGNEAVSYLLIQGVGQYDFHKI